MSQFEFRQFGRYDHAEEHRDLFVRARVAGGLTPDEAASYADRALQAQLENDSTYRLAAFAGDSLVGAFVAYEDRVDLANRPSFSEAMQLVMGRSLNGDYTQGTATFAHVTELVTDPEHRAQLEPELAINGLRGARGLYGTQFMKLRLTSGASAELFGGSPENTSLAGLGYGFAATETGLPGHGVGPAVATRNEYIGLIGDGIAFMQDRMQATPQSLV